MAGLPNPDGIRIRTQAGGILTNLNVHNWLNASDLYHPMEDDKVVDVYVEQVCYYVNRCRGLIEPDGRPNNMRAMLSQPQAFYNTIVPLGGEVEGSEMLRTAGITRVEFGQLEYFFMPISFNEHSCLVVISPLDRTVELADSNVRSYSAMSGIFHVVIRFLIHELGQLIGPEPWRFLYRQAPRQDSKANCGNFTCRYAKALALQNPLTPTTDVGQGPDNALEKDSLRHFVINDLEVAEWTEATFPMGNTSPIRRHYAPDSTSEPQHRLFWIPDAEPTVKDREAVDIRTLRSRTGRHDRRNGAELGAWCEAQPSLRDRNGNMVPGMRRYEQWALLSLQDFVTRVEEREADILNGLFP
jgi:hypothetical protein